MSMVEGSKNRLFELPKLTKIGTIEKSKKTAHHGAVSLQ
jgi:hypothetical protein